MGRYILIIVYKSYKELYFILMKIIFSLLDLILNTCTSALGLYHELSGFKDFLISKALGVPLFLVSLVGFIIAVVKIYKRFF